jgi:hypothetical protein
VDHITGFTNGQCDPASYLEPNVPYFNSGKKVIDTTNPDRSYGKNCTDQIPTSPKGGNCDIDVDECSSVPCQHDGFCKDSRSDPSLGPDKYVCECTNYTYAWKGLLELPMEGWMMNRVPEVSMEKFLTRQPGDSIWNPDTNCETRALADLRCEPGQQLNLKRRSKDKDGNDNQGVKDTLATPDDGGNIGKQGWEPLCVDCGKGTFSRHGGTCEGCPDVVVPEDWWCRALIGPTGKVLKPAGNCTRRIQCSQCFTGEVPNEERTGCIDAMAAKDDSLATLGDSAASTISKGALEMKVDPKVFTSDKTMMDALLAKVKAALAKGMSGRIIVKASDIGIDGLFNAGRRLQTGQASAVLAFQLKPSSNLGSKPMYILETILKDKNSVAAKALGGLGGDTSSFSVNAGCPEGKMKAGADVLCHTCPFPDMTKDSATCVTCPANQVRRTQPTIQDCVSYGLTSVWVHLTSGPHRKRRWV